MDDNLSKNTTIHISSKSHLNLTFNLCQCGVNEIAPGHFLAISPSDIFTFMCVSAGDGLLETGGLAFKITTRQGFFAFPDTHYNLQNIGDVPLHITWLSFTGYLVENYLNRANIFRARPVFADPDGQVSARLEGIYAASQKLPNRYCRMMSMLYGIFSHLLDANPTRDEGYVDSADFYAVRAVTYIEHNYAMNLSVDEIAAALGISRKHLYHVFNNTLKISPKQYLIYYRIEKACMRLKSSGQSVLEIAESVGYSNQFYFAKEFKRLTGVTPSEYRKTPQRSELFSYRTFVPTLRERLPDDKLDFPIEESIISVYSPPLPAAREDAE